MVLGEDRYVVRIDETMPATTHIYFFKGVSRNDGKGFGRAFVEEGTIRFNAESVCIVGDRFSTIPFLRNIALFIDYSMLSA